MFYVSFLLKNLYFTFLNISKIIAMDNEFAGFQAIMLVALGTIVPKIILPFPNVAFSLNLFLIDNGIW